MGTYKGLIFAFSAIIMVNAQIWPSSFQLCKIEPFFEQSKEADLVITAKVRQYVNLSEKDSNVNWGLQLEILHIYKGKSVRKYITVLQQLASVALRQGVYKLGSTWVFALKNGVNRKYKLLNCQGRGPLRAEKGYVYGCIAKKCDPFGNQLEKMTHRDFSRKLAEKIQNSAKKKP